MMIALRLFVSSALFATTIATAYWFFAKEPTGTLLLGVMAFGLFFVAGYTVLAERDANLLGDRRDANPIDGAGESLGSFSVRSPLPVWAALAIVCVLLGLVVNSAIAALGVVAVLIAGVFFILQSR